MSKERARRRAEREAAQSRVPAAARGGAKPRGRSPLRVLPASRRRRSRADSILRVRRRRQDVALLAVLVVLNALLWTQVSSWSLRATAAVLSLLAWPVLVILVFDRRPSS